MTLEDHVGDILRKARRASNVLSEAAAKAAGLQVRELELLEGSGQCQGRPNLAALAALVGLDGTKLEQIAGGWLPTPRELGCWRMLRLIATTRNGNTVNCYLVWDEASREAAFFDTGWEAQPILDLAAEHHLELKHLFVTHAHTDHIAAVGEIRERFPKVLLHMSSRRASPRQRNRPDDSILLGKLHITNRPTPGHADDGVIYVVDAWPQDAPRVAIVGDTIFAGSLATGFVSTQQLKQSVESQVFSLPPETLLCPGHGPVTTVAEEKAHNPFF